MLYEFKLGETIERFEVGTTDFTYQNQKFAYCARNLAPSLVSMIVEGEVFSAWVVKKDDTFFVQVNGEEWQFSEYDPLASSFGEDTAQKKSIVLAPMPGKVVKLFVKIGDLVKVNAPLIIIESMKMETEIFAAIDGEIMECSFLEGAQFTQGDVLIKFKEG